MAAGIANIFDKGGPRVRLAHCEAADVRHDVALGPVHPLRKRGGRKTDGDGGQSEVAEPTGQQQRLYSAGSAASAFWYNAGLGQTQRQSFQTGAEFRIPLITQNYTHVDWPWFQPLGGRHTLRVE